MRNFVVTVGAMVVTVPVTFLVIWLGFMLLGAIVRIAITGLPVVAVGGVIIFVCQMLEGRGD